MHGPRLGFISKRTRVAGIVYASSAILGCSSDSDEALPVQPSESVLDFVEALPLNPLAYTILAVAFVVIWGSHMYRRRTGARHVHPRWTAARKDLDVVDALRSRGSALRARADSLLLSAVVLLVAGTYFVIWVVPRIETSDYLIKFEDRLQAWGAGEYWAQTHSFDGPHPTSMSVPKEQGDQEILDFGNGRTLRALNDGRHWREAKAATNAPNVDPPNDAACDGVSFFADDGNHGVCSSRWELRACLVAIADGGELIELPAEEGEPFSLLDTRGEVTAFEFSPNLEHGLIGTSDGAIHLTADGGRTWESRKRQDMGLNEAEWVVGAVVGDTGPLLVVGDEGSVRVADGREWEEPSGLGESGPTAFEFSPNLEHGLIGTRDGAIHLTADGGRTWERRTRQEVGLNEAEWVVGAVVGDTGPLLVVGDEGSVRVADGREWEEPSGLGRPTAFEFSPNLEHGLIGTRDGAIHLTANGGRTWERRTRQEVGLNEAEWVVGAVVGDTGPLFVVGDEGSVRVADGREWEESSGLGESGATAFEFHPDLKHGLIGTRDGAIHLTANGGETWERRTRQEVGLNEAEWVVEAVVGDEGPLLVVGDEGTIRTRDGKSWVTPCDDAGGQWQQYIRGSAGAVAGLWGKTRVVTTTADGGKNWERSKTLTGPAEELLEVDEFLARGGRAGFRTSKGSVWTKKEDGNWEEEKVLGDERAATIALGLGGEIVIVGNEGFLAIGEKTFGRSGEFDAEQSRIVAAAMLRGGNVVVLDDGGTLYLRRKPEKDDTLSAIYRSLPQESQLAGEIARERGDSSRLPPEERTWIEKLGIDEQYLMRIAVLFATIYIVLWLVRLHQYTLRLAAFWDSRADAVMLGSTFSEAKPSFDGLVAALAPDALDFKPPKWPIFASRTALGGATAGRQGP